MFDRLHQWGGLSLDFSLLKGFLTINLNSLIDVGLFRLPISSWVLVFGHSSFKNLVYLISRHTYELFFLIIFPSVCVCGLILISFLPITFFRLALLLLVFKVEVVRPLLFSNISCYKFLSKHSLHFKLLNVVF